MAELLDELWVVLQVIAALLVVSLLTWVNSAGVGGGQWCLRGRRRKG